MDINADMLAKLLEEAQTASKRLAVELATRRQEILKVEQAQEDLRTEVAGYQLALRRLFPDDSTPEQADVVLEPEPVEATEAHAVDLASIGRAAAVEHAVRALAPNGASTSPAEIEQFMSDRGRVDTRDQIGAALAYLNKRGTVERTSRAQWRVRIDEGADAAHS